MIVRRQKREEKTFRRRELPGKFMAKKLFGWSDKRYDKEYWGKQERRTNKRKKNLRNNQERRRRN